MADHTRQIKSFTLHPRVIACITKRAHDLGMTESTTVEWYVKRSEEMELATFEPGIRVVKK